MEAIKPVLIVGAGPSGLMCAHELMRFSIPCTIIEKDLEKSPYSRAIGVQIRTLEIFSALGLFTRLADKSQHVNAVEIFAEGRPPVFMPIDVTSSFFDRLLIVDQPHTELVLEEALMRFLKKILRGVELIDFSQEKDGINARLRHQNGEERNEQFSYIIGADGAHSVVRKKMSNQFSGSTYEDAFILADAECIHALDHHSFRIFFHKKLFLVLIPMHGKNHYRLISIRRGESKKAGPVPTIEEFQDLAQAVVPFPLEIKNPVWVSRFFVQCRSASQYQDERAFLVGDAAHIHSPAGGQGMNTGLQDAFNLAWKLAMTLRGYATLALLQTYHPERKPVGDFLIRYTDRFFKFMVRSSIWARLLRRFVLPRIARSKKQRSRLIMVASQTAIRYQDGALCKNGPHITIPSVKMGMRIPNLLLIDNHLAKTDLHTLTRDLNFSVLFFLPKQVQKKIVKKAAIASENLSMFQQVKTHLIFLSDFDAEKTITNNDYFVVNAVPTFPIDQPSFIIVRPDHHVFCMGEIKDIDHVKDSLKNFLVEKGN